MEEEPEPWLRGPIAGVHPLVMPVVFSFRQVREDLDRHTSGLSVNQVWRQVGRSSLGFHLKHIAGSVRRLSAYLADRPLTEDDLAALRAEATPDQDLASLRADIENALHDAEVILHAIDPNQLYHHRHVGRKQLPTTVQGLLVHLAEHTQRHLGQAILCAQIVRLAG
jgi:hypothetical protein